MSLFSTSPASLLKQGLVCAGLSLCCAAGPAQAQSGNALNFDGTNDYVNLPASLTTGVTNFTFEAWLNYQDNGLWTRVLDFGNNPTVNMFLTPRNGDNNAPRFAITTGGGGAEQRLTSTTALSAGQHHLAVTLSQNGTLVTGTLYVDGVVAATNANMTLTPSSLGTLTNLYLGRSQYNDPYLKGDLDEVRVYSAALSQAQVQADMRATTGTSAVPASLRAYYNFNQGVPKGNNPTVTTLLDQSGNARTGTLVNFALTGITSNWIGDPAPLPVTLVRFAAQCQQQEGLLTWATASETHNAYFEVESSADGVTFHALGRVVGAGTTSQAHTYQFADADLARYATTTVYYRLRQVDTDGSSTYSPVRTVALPTGAGAVATFPSPLAAGQRLTLQLNVPQAGLASLLVTDALGRTVLQQPLDLRASPTTITLPQAAQWTPGVYALRVQQGRWQQVTKITRE